jgi:hypothetical protein
MFNWLWRLLGGTSEITTKPESVGQAGLDNQVGEKVVRNRRAVPAKKSNPVAKPTRVRSNNTSKTSGKSAGKAVRTPASKSKSKSKTVPKGKVT